MVDMNLEKFIEKMVGKSKKDEEQPTKTLSSETTTIPISEAVSDQPISSKTIYVKSMILNSIEELEKIKVELKFGNILILKLTPLIDLDIDDVKNVVRNLKRFTSKIDGDIASLGEDRIIVTPHNIKIWKEKTE